MAQGTRGRWMRVAATGFGVLLCTGLIGCTNTDKDKKDKAAKQPTQGLPNTPMLGPNGQPIAKSGAPANQFGTGGVQQTGGFQPTSTVGQQRYPSTGLNTNTGSGLPPTGTGYNPYGPAQPGNPGTIGTPAQQGIVPNVLPVNGSNPAAPGSWGGMNTAGPNTPGAIASNSPTHYDQLPPPAAPLPPGSSTAPGSEFAGVGVQPPTNTLAPLAPLAPPTSQQPISSNFGAFGNR